MVIPLTYAEVNGQRWSWCESKMQRLHFKRSIADAAVDGVVPEGHLRSPAQAHQDLMAWLERLYTGDLAVITRPKITIPLPDLGPADAERRVRTYGDFSTMNRSWRMTATRGCIGEGMRTSCPVFNDICDESGTRLPNRIRQRQRRSLALAPGSTTPPMRRATAGRGSSG